jgi:hypothetical protein
MLLSVAVFAVGIIAFNQPVLANDHATHIATTNDAIITEISAVTPSSTTPSTTTTYTITFTTAAEIHGSLMFGSRSIGCPNNTNWLNCRINLAGATLQSFKNDALENMPGDLSAWDEGFAINVPAGLVADTYTVVLANVGNPAVPAAAYRLSGRGAQGEMGENPPSTPSDPFYFITPAVKGTLKLPDGTTPVQNAGVNFHTQNYSFQTNSSTDDWGFYAVSSTGVSNGTYMIDFWVSNIDGYIAPSSAEIAYAGSTVTHNAQLVVASKMLTGTARYTDGSIVTTGGEVFLNKRGGGNGKNATLGVGGTYSISLDGGEWDVSLNAGWGQNGPRLVDWAQPQMQSVSFSNDSVVENKVVNFSLVKTNAQVKGRILKPNGQPMSNGSIELRQGQGQGMSSGMNQEGRFTINVSDGTYKLNVWFDQNNPDYAMLYYPEATVTVNANQILDVGDIYLSQKNASLTGTVTLVNGNPASGVSINCWQQGSFGWGRGTSNAAGVFVVGVTPGSWQCDLDRGGNSTYIMAENRPPTQYEVSANQTITGVNFVVKQADARLNVRLVDRNGNALTNMNGYAYAQEKGVEMMPGNQYGTGVNRGIAAIALVGGKTYRVGFNAPQDQSDYLLDSEVEVTIGQGEEKAVTLTLVEPDARITGWVQDQNGQVVTNADIEVNVGTDGGGMWSNTRLNPNGSYTLRVKGGKTYMINFFFRNRGDFVQTNSQDAPFDVPTGATITKILTAYRADSKVVAQVLDPNGNPIPFGYVWCSNRMYMEDKMKGDFAGGKTIEAGNEVRNGAAQVALIAGKYQCGTGTLPGQNLYMPPESVEVEVSPSAPASITLQYRQADAYVTGTVTLDNGSSPRMGWCHAFEASKASSNQKGAGGFSGGQVNDGGFSIPLTLGTWYIGCDSQSSSGFYRSDEKIVSITSKGTQTQNFTLSKQAWDLPKGLTEVFDSTTQKSVTLPDGTTLTIPANSLATSGNVTFIASPNINLFYTPDTKPVNFAWDFSVMDSNNALIQSFNSNVTICIPYDDSQLRDQGIDEADVVAKYYNTTSGVWQLPDGVTQDTAANTVCFSVSHFTNFALASGTNGGSGQVADYNIIAAPLSKGGPQIVVSDETGKVVSKFFAYAQSLRVSLQAVTGDVDGDGQTEIVVAAGTGAGPQVRIFTMSGQLKKQFFAYDQRYRFGVNLNVADVTGDGVAEIITSLMAGGKPEIAIYNGTGKTLKRFYAYAQSFLGGVNVVTGDVNGDGSDEIITVPASKGGPEIAVYNGSGKTLKRFMAYDKRIRGGYNIETGDINGDGKAEIVIAQPAGGTTEIAAFTGTGSTVKRFYAYARNFKGGVNISVGDTNGDGSDEIVTAPASMGGPEVAVYSGTGKTLKRFMAYAKTLRGGYSVFAADINGDGLAEIVTAPGAGMGPQVRTFNQAGTALKSFFPLAQSFRGGLWIAPGLQ